MQGENLVGIWFVFRILKFVVNYGDLVSVTFILYGGFLEILNLQLIYKFS
jgi:hypothetical protein